MLARCACALSHAQLFLDRRPPYSLMSRFSSPLSSLSEPNEDELLMPIMDESEDTKEVSMVRVRI